MGVSCAWVAKGVSKAVSLSSAVPDGQSQGLWQQLLRSVSVETMVLET